MATKTEDLIHKLTVEVNVLKEQVQILLKEAEPVRAIMSQVAVIEHRLSEITKTKELWGQRGWMILTIVLSATFSFLAVIFGALLTFYLNSRR